MATISYDIRATQEAMRAKAEAAALAAGKSAIEADSIGNAAGNNVGASELARIRGELGNNSASDDGSNAGTNNTAADPAGSTTVSNRSQTGQKSGVPNSSNKDQIDQQFPGARKTNPLSNYSSYSPIITLYMVSPTVYNGYCDSGGVLPQDTTSKSQTFVVAQSGGINNQADKRAITLSEQLGANQTGLDYYIEDLSWSMLMPCGTSPSPSTDITFKIVEPVGYTFLTRLAKASRALKKISGNDQSASTIADQFFIIGIKFYGYDVNGNITSSQASSRTSSSSSDTSTSITDRYLAIRISKMSFKINGNATIYNVDAYNVSEQGTSGFKNGQLATQGEVFAAKGKVGEALQGLMDKLNKFQQDQLDLKKIEIPVTYKIKYLSNAEDIKNASLLDDAEVEAKLSTMSSGVKTTSQSNIKQGVQAVTNNIKGRLTSFAAGTSVLTAIDNIIVKSDYVTRALIKVNNEASEAKTLDNAAAAELKWFSINQVAKIIGTVPDAKTGTWAYDITYEISSYSVPYIRSDLVTKKVLYPGPFKLYNYILTGENSEVLDYEVTLDNLFTNIDLGRSNVPDNVTAASTLGAGVTNAPGTAVNSNSTGGKLNQGSALNDNVRVQLGIPGGGDLAKFTMKIMGDPDYLMTQVGAFQDIGGTKGDTVLKNLYGDNLTINPMAGQVFIQIIFNVAEDYNDLNYNKKATDGLIDITEDINFYTDSSVRKNGIKGQVYIVEQVAHSFSKGLFTQTLQGRLADTNLLVTSDSSSTSTDSGRESTTSGSKTTSTTATSTNATSQGDIRKFENAQLVAEQANKSTIAQVQNFEQALNAKPKPDDDQIVANKPKVSSKSTDTAREVGALDRLYSATSGLNSVTPRQQRIRN